MADDFVSGDDSFNYSDEETDRYNYCEKDGFSDRDENFTNVSSKQLGQHGGKLLSKYYNKITIEKYSGPDNLSHRATNKLIEHSRALDHKRVRVKDKHDRATVEQVLDPRTRMILFKLLSKNVVSEINGCISTGKEANVYHATSPYGDRAIKIYKTSILTFKDRDRYVTGEFRFRHGYCRGNPRKMVATWAEKEMRNLLRLRNAGLPCPEAVILRGHVLVMEFLGSDGWPSPILKEAKIDNHDKLAELHFNIMLIMRRMYKHCKLVHADLSEYNLIYHNEQAYIIDVSQSVEHDHPHALEFLRKDCENIIEYFRRNGQNVLFVKELFSFITDPTIQDEEADEKLNQLLENSAKNSKESNEECDQDKIEDEFFKKVFIAKRLDEVAKFEDDTEQAKKSTKPEVFYPIVTGLKDDLSGAKCVANNIILKTGSSNESENEDDDSSSSSRDNNDESSSSSENGLDQNGQNFTKKNSSSIRDRDESPGTKKARKLAVKEGQREKRKTKTPKHVKKRREKLAKTNSKR